MVSASISLLNGRLAKTPTGLFINNEWVESSDKGTFSTINPATGEHLLDISSATSEDVDKAVKAARTAFKTTWGRNAAPSERARLLNKLADLMERDAQHLGELESIDSGKGLRIARDFDIGDSVACLRYFAGWADKIGGQTIDVGKSKMVYTTQDPIGVCGQIIPWNYPIMMWCWKTGPALAAGCTIIMKPSELTPLTALALCDLIVEAGFPAGVVNTLPGLGSVTGAAISSHMGIDKIAFTGSVITGRRIMAAAANSNLKKVTLELGGKVGFAPFLLWVGGCAYKVGGGSHRILSLDRRICSKRLLGAQWQSSTTVDKIVAPERVFMSTRYELRGQSKLLLSNSRWCHPQKCYDEFMPLLITAAKACAIGDPWDDATSFGPLVRAALFLPYLSRKCQTHLCPLLQISELQRDKVLAYIESGVSEGAKIATGGKTWGSKGFYVEPTVLTDCTSKMKCVVEEIFGPVLVVSKFSSEEEVLELANDSTYGLGAAVFTGDAKQAMRVSAELSAGSVWVNQYGILHSSVPFGGYKMSGIGRELGSHGVNEYTITKSVHHNISEEMSWPV
ncbi:hypothetical protein P7C70_g8749, partial [Phenoliferia sp. Uapishka_3]